MPRGVLVDAGGGWRGHDSAVHAGAGVNPSSLPLTVFPALTLIPPQTSLYSPPGEW